MRTVDSGFGWVALPSTTTPVGTNVKPDGEPAIAILVHLGRLAFVYIVELQCRTQYFAGVHRNLMAIFVEKNVPLALPRRIQQRVRTAAPLRQPKIP